MPKRAQRSWMSCTPSSDQSHSCREASIPTSCAIFDWSQE